MTLTVSKACRRREKHAIQVFSIDFDGIIRLSELHADCASRKESRCGLQMSSRAIGCDGFRFRFPSKEKTSRARTRIELLKQIISGILEHRPLLTWFRKWWVNGRKRNNRYLLRSIVDGFGSKINVAKREAIIVRSSIGIVAGIKSQSIGLEIIFLWLFDGRSFTGPLIPSHNEWKASWLCDVIIDYWVSIQPSAAIATRSRHSTEQFFGCLCLLIARLINGVG